MSNHPKKTGWLQLSCVLALSALLSAGYGCEEKKTNSTAPKPPGKGAGDQGTEMKASVAPEPGTAPEKEKPKKHSSKYTPTFAQFSALPEIDSVTWDDRGRMMVNGKKFFPIALYDADFDADYYAMYRDFSFNTLLCSKLETILNMRESGFYAGAYHGAASRADSLGSVLFVVGIDSPGHELAEPAKQVEAEVKKIHEAAPGRPVFHAMAYWEKDKHAYQGQGVYGKDKYEDIFKLNDISAPFLYPVPQFKIAEIVPAYDRIKSATEGKKPLIPIQQLFAWRENERFPTPEELRTMVMFSLVKGADGIGYYSYNRCRNGKPVNIEDQNYALWKSLKETNLLAKRVGEFYLTSSPTNLISVESEEKNVFWRVESQGDNAVLVITNLAEKEAPVTIKVKGETFAMFCRMENGEPITVSSGIVSMSLPALSSTVITTDRSLVLPTAQ